VSVDLLERGQLNPIKVQERNQQSERYKVIDGEHRIAAAKLVGITKLQAQVIAISDEDAYALAITANKSRSREIETLDLAYALARLHRLGRRETEIADRLKFSQTKVSLLIGLAERATLELRQMMITRAIGARTAMSLATFPPEIQRSVLETVRASEEPLSHRDIVRIARGDPEPAFDLRCKCGRMYSREGDRIVEVD
jgi:ParB-like chromosome segregation protein Spo0J